MITRFLLTFALLVVMAVPSVACEGNAALQYWKAFALLPELSAEQTSAIRDALAGGPVTDELKEIVKSSETALKEMAKGVAAEDCEWGISLDEGPEATLPHLSKARILALVTCLRAKLSFESGETEGAIDDIVAVMTLARDADQGNLLISLLVDYAIERTAIETVTSSLSSVDSDGRKALAEAIQALPSLPTISDAVTGEKILADWLIRVLEEPGSKPRVIALFRGIDSEAIKAIRTSSREELLAAAKQLPAFYDRLAEVAALPPSKMQKAEKRLFANPGIEGPGREMALGLTPAITAAKTAEADHQARLANLMDALSE